MSRCSTICNFCRLWVLPGFWSSPAAFCFCLASTQGPSLLSCPAKWRLPIFSRMPGKVSIRSSIRANLPLSIALSCFIWRWRAAAPGVFRATGSRRRPFDRTANRWSLILGCRASDRDTPHGLDHLPPRPGWQRARAALIQAATVFQFEVLIVAEVIRRADRVIGAGHRLALVVKVGERQIMQFGEEFHIGEGILGIVFGVVRANGGEANALRHEHAGICGKPVDHRFDIGAVVANKDDHRAVFARDVAERISPAIGGRKPEIRGWRLQDELCCGCSHARTSL